MDVSKITRALIATLSVCVATTSIAQIDARTAIQSNYDKVSRLSMKKDITRLEKTIRRNAASNFHTIDSFQNTLDIGATVRQNIDQLSKVGTFTTNENKIMAIKPRGHDLVCTVQTNYDLVLADKKKTRVTGTVVSEDTWIKTLKGWKIKQSKVVKESSSVACFALDKSIKGSYEKVQTATLKKDVAAMKQIWKDYVDPSCVEDRNGTKTSAAKMIQSFERQMKQIKKVNSCKIEVTNSKSKGGKVVCTVETKQSFVIAVKGKDSIFDVVSVVEDTWQKVNGKYKIVEMKSIKDTLKQDGKLVSGG